MNHKEKILMVENMRRYGGNFVRRLADAMIAADPVNFKILCDSFPEYVKQYSRIQNLQQNSDQSTVYSL